MNENKGHYRIAENPEDAHLRRVVKQIVSKLSVVEMNSRDDSNLTHDSLRKTFEHFQPLRPKVYYIASSYTPKTDPETGDDVFFAIQPYTNEPDIEFVIVIHTELLSVLHEYAKNGRYELIDYRERVTNPQAPKAPIIGWCQSEDKNEPL